MTRTERRPVTMAGPARWAGRNPAELFSGLAVALVLLASWLRLWQLYTLPPGLWFDESLNAMEAVQMLKTGHWPIFIVEGQGREVLFHYLLAGFIWALGGAVYVVRLAPALLGVLSVALMYRWALAICRGERSGRWLALLAAAGLAVSFWYLVMNRVGYRANTLLPLWLASGYFFWRGWQSGKWGYYVAAGLGLGLCQYTYLAGRLAPLVVILFYTVQGLAGRERDRFRQAGPGLLLTLAVAGLVFLPLLLFFTRQPELFWERGGDVALDLNQGGWSALGRQALAAVRIFIDAGDPNWRHHLVGQPGLDLFSKIGFWIGLALAVRSFYRPAYTFLLATLAVMGLPALLSDPAFHSLRLVGLLPAYYTLSAIGWLAVAHRLPLAWPAGRSRGAFVLIALLLFSGGGTWTTYFYRWAERPEVAQAFDAPVVDLAHYLVSPASGPDVIIPFYLYAHASLRYLMADSFAEAVLLPQEVADRLAGQAETRLVLPEYPPDDGLPPALVWLVKDSQGKGTAYVSAVNRQMSPGKFKPQAAPVVDGAGQIIARQVTLAPGEVLDLFPARLPGKPAGVAWADNLRLSHYEFSPASGQAGPPVRLDLAWQLLDYTGLEQKMLLQLIDSRGQPAGQQEVDPISRKMYRWRENRLVLEQHSLPLDPGLAAGLYFVRLGFFHPASGDRLAAVDLTGRPLGDEFIAGPFYLARDGVDPTRPERSLQANLDGKFELLGYSLYAVDGQPATRVGLTWRVLAGADRDYTVFVQWLDGQNNVLAQVDAQPLLNLYPTSRWQPGEILTDQFELPVPVEKLAGQGRLVTGMYDLASGARLPVFDAQGQPLVNELIQLAD